GQRATVLGRDALDLAAVHLHQPDNLAVNIRVNDALYKTTTTLTSMEKRLKRVPRIGTDHSRPSLLAASPVGSARKVMSVVFSAWAQASSTKGSLTDMHTTVSTPL